MNKREFKKGKNVFFSNNIYYMTSLMEQKDIKLSRIFILLCSPRRLKRGCTEGTNLCLTKVVCVMN